MRSIILILFFLSFNYRLEAGEGIAYPGAEKVFLKEGFFKINSPRSFENFSLFCYKLIKDLKSDKQIFALKYALKILNKSKKSKDVIEKKMLFEKAQRVVYSVLAKGAPKPRPPTPTEFYKQLMLHHHYITVNLAGQVGNKIDVNENNYWWYTKNRIRSWEELELSAERIISDSLKTKYEIVKFKKVLFFKKIGNSGTSPKVKALDALGIKWKIKWGSEVQTEPVANRLYLALGGKYVDLVYANKRGTEGLTLVLGEKEKKQNCSKNISSVDYLRHCFLNVSAFKFELYPFIFDRGVVTENNVDRVLNKLPNSSLKKYQKSSLIGREYVTFKESSVELTDKVLMKRIGPATTNLFNSENNLATKGLFLFNLWIWNSDAKEDNNRTLFLKNIGSNSFDYVETQHDMGASFGPPAYPGSINKLSIGSAFLKVDISHRYKFDQKFIYFPRSWKNATSLDLLWFAKKITNLKVDIIKQIVDKTNWPSHIKDVFAYRLIMRRNRIAEIFGLTSMLDQEKIIPPSITIDLSTNEKQVQAATNFNIETKYFLKFVSKYKIKSDVLVKNGLIISCEKSIINNLLETTLYPSGLTRRLSRKADNLPLAGCKYTP
jgi:hypothetical protein